MIANWGLCECRHRGELRLVGGYKSNIMNICFQSKYSFVQSKQHGTVILKSLLPSLVHKNHNF